jgi:hypothetical protein
MARRADGAAIGGEAAGVDIVAIFHRGNPIFAAERAGHWKYSHIGGAGYYCDLQPARHFT